MTKYFVWVTNRDDSLIIRSLNLLAQPGVILMKSFLKIEYYWDNKSGWKFVKGPKWRIKWESHPHE